MTGWRCFLSGTAEPFALLVVFVVLVAMIGPLEKLKALPGLRGADRTNVLRGLPLTFVPFCESGAAAIIVVGGEEDFRDHGCMPTSSSFDHGDGRTGPVGERLISLGTLKCC